MDLLFFLTGIFLWGELNANILPSEVFKVISSKHKDHIEGCSDIILTNPSGIISSPNYPASYPNHVSCSWHISGNSGDTITISFVDLDIEESGKCLELPCCIYSWVKFGPTLNATEKQICGHQIPAKPFVSTSQKVSIKFHISNFAGGGRGFRLYYTIAPRQDFECKSTDTKCDNGECIPGNARCNGIQECRDGSDELLCSDACPSGQQSCRSVLLCYDNEKHCNGIVDCPDFSDEYDCNFCALNQTQCGPNSKHCYNKVTQRCNRELDCPNGEDEKDCLLCPDKIMCASGEGCYALKDRCNGIPQCGDGSDEKKCGSDLCNYERNGFLCHNGHCIREMWKCDRTNDCGDGSDEINCVRNSILTAAIVGSVICAVLLVIAISCTCRLQALRSLENNLLQRETPLSRMNREFFFREPPPSYAVATGQHQQNLCVENFHYETPPRRSQRRTQRPRRYRERSSTHSVLDDLVNHNCIVVSPDGSVTVRSPEGMVPLRHGRQMTGNLLAPNVSASCMRPVAPSRVPDVKDEPNCVETEEDKTDQNDSKDKTSSSEDESSSSSSANQTFDDDDAIVSNFEDPPPYSCDSDNQPLLT